MCKIEATSISYVICSLSVQVLFVAIIYYNMNMTYVGADVTRTLMTKEILDDQDGSVEEQD